MKTQVTHLTKFSHWLIRLMPHRKHNLLTMLSSLDEESESAIVGVTRTLSSVSPTLAELDSFDPRQRQRVSSAALNVINPTRHQAKMSHKLVFVSAASLLCLKVKSIIKFSVKSFPSPLLSVQCFPSFIYTSHALR